MKYPHPHSDKRKKMYTSSREEEEDAQRCPCRKAQQSRTHIMGEYEIHKEERDVLEMSKTDECDTEKFGTLDSSEKTIASLGDRWWPQTAKQEGDTISKKFLCSIWKKIMSAQKLKVSLFGVGTVLRLERDAW